VTGPAPAPLLAGPRSDPGRPASSAPSAPAPSTIVWAEPALTLPALASAASRAHPVATKIVPAPEPGRPGAGANRPGEALTARPLPNTAAAATGEAIACPPLIVPGPCAPTACRPTTPPASPASAVAQRLPRGATGVDRALPGLATGPSPPPRPRGTGTGARGGGRSVGALRARPRQSAPARPPSSSVSASSASRGRARAPTAASRAPAPGAASRATSAAPAPPAAPRQARGCLAACSGPASALAGPAGVTGVPGEVAGVRVGDGWPAPPGAGACISAARASSPRGTRSPARWGVRPEPAFRPRAGGGSLGPLGAGSGSRTTSVPTPQANPEGRDGGWATRRKRCCSNAVSLRVWRRARAGKGYLRPNKLWQPRTGSGGASHRQFVHAAGSGSAGQPGRASRLPCGRPCSGRMRVTGPIAGRLGASS